jgi:hypothetical protein
MRRAKLIVGVLGLMMAMMVAFAAPAMAQEFEQSLEDGEDNGGFCFDDDFFFDDDFCFDDRNDFFDDGFNSFDQKADSGDVDQSFTVSGEGDNSNQCVSINGTANTGNLQTQTGFTQTGDGNFDNFDNDRFFDDDFFFYDDDHFFDNFDRFDDGNNFEFDDINNTLDVGGTTTTTCDQEVNQAAAAG